MADPGKDTEGLLIRFFLTHLKATRHQGILMVNKQKDVDYASDLDKDRSIYV
ncbi:hypothetical protein Scep_014769 [Stephania cephalantha]|uniref:Uncharacterized protein n=1 Tax=Stephania cephalantha TaxID=152367 RepID=A0AAP0J1Y4_9MAGN